MIPASERLSRVLRALLSVVLLFGVCAASAQDQPAQTQQKTYKPEELEALVAPIALYPDSVLSQALMASTYPLEIVLAARWVKANPNVKGDAAVKAVANETWDVSVKSLVAFPQVLEPMSDKLDWTQKLGDAFLAQEKEVLDAVQRLRAKAQQAGNLKTNEQQTVIVEPATTTTQTIVRIEPANPEVIYVPAYDPMIVYGGWGYPYYPPYYWPPYPAYYPGAAFVSGFAWGVGFAVAGAIFGGCNWHGGSVNINVNRAANIDRNFNRNNVGSGGEWRHDAGHRKGVAYRDNATREKFGRNNPGANNRGDFRGRTPSAGNRAGDRGGVGGAGGVSDRGNLGNRPQTTDRPGGGSNPGSSASRDRAFQGVGGGTASQRDFDRGRSSAGASNLNRPSSGGARGGGGGARGGGGGRGGGRR
jgi:hypothetical protein